MGTHAHFMVLKSDKSGQSKFKATSPYAAVWDLFRAALTYGRFEQHLNSSRCTGFMGSKQKRYAARSILLRASIRLHRLSRRTRH
jgi:hypothetical protein